jgi:dinuclear metal center YbgI/SA1388 family protein
MTMMRASDVARAIEAFAPLSYQESYDNSGFQAGDPQTEIKGILFTLDITEAVVEEARARGCSMIVAHHPVIFGGLKRLTGASYVERVVMAALRHGIVLYASHTNLDNVRNGVNAVFADKLGLQSQRILQPMDGSLNKLYTYVPTANAETLRDALFAAGAGAIGKYSECSFGLEGSGTFRAASDANPTIGEAGGPRETQAETKLEVLVPRHLERKVLQALFTNHPYEEVAYEMIRLQNANQELGAGLIGELPLPMEPAAFLRHLKDRMGAACVRHTELPGKPVQRVAICGGSGSFLLKQAIAQGADAFVSADYKYHQFFDAEGRILIADIGHWESEQYTIELLRDIIAEKNPTFALLLSQTKTNPVNYFI